MNPKHAVASLAALPLMLLTTAAHAVEPAAPSGSPGAPRGEAVEDERLPVAEAERPMTLPKMILGAELDFDVPHISFGGFGKPTTYANLSLGGSFGVTDDLTVRAQVLPLQLTGPAGTGFHYGQDSAYFGGIDNPGPGIGATYRFAKSETYEVGVSLDVNLITVQTVTGAVITPGIPVRLHFQKKVRIDTGAFLTFTRATESVPGGPSLSANGTGLSIPVSALYDITEPIHVGVATGFGIADLSDIGNNTYIPLGIFAGYAVKGAHGPVLDIDPFFTFPTLLTPGAAAGGTNSATYVVGLSVGGFLYL